MGEKSKEIIIMRGELKLYGKICIQCGSVQYSMGLINFGNELIYFCDTCGDGLLNLLTKFVVFPAIGNNLISLDTLP